MKRLFAAFLASLLILPAGCGSAFASHWDMMEDAMDSEMAAAAPVSMDMAVSDTAVSQGSFMDCCGPNKVEQRVGIAESAPVEKTLKFPVCPFAVSDVSVGYVPATPSATAYPPTPPPPDPEGYAGLIGIVKRLD